MPAVFKIKPETVSKQVIAELLATLPPRTLRKIASNLNLDPDKEDNYSLAHQSIDYITFAIVFHKPKTTNE